MIIIYGPTGSGKTALSLSLAKRLNAEIINMDIGSFYTPLSIGTAKPDWRKESVPHHLFDILDTPTNYSVSKYRADVQRLLQEIKSRGATPILVGGSGFYLKSLFFPPTGQPTAGQLTSNDKTTDQLWLELQAIDPRRAASIHRNDRYRIERALFIWQQTGTLPSLQAPLFDPIADDITIIHVTRDRAQLYERINSRVAEMLKQGWIEEVRALRDTDWEQFLRQGKLIGYDDILDYLDGQSSEDALYALEASIATKTRNYAKRQETFWRMLERQLREHASEHLVRMQTINLTLIDLELYIKQLLDHYPALNSHE